MTRTKKTFVSRARLVKGSRWHIDFTRFNPETGDEKRHRLDFDLNEIEDVRVREEVGVRLAKHIDMFAPPPAPAKKKIVADGKSLKDAVVFGVAVKQKLPRKSSRRPYNTVATRFLLWCDKMGIANLPVRQFTKKHAAEYWDWLTTTYTLRGRTLNNYLERLNGLWAEMKKRELVKKNPWSKIDSVRNETKLRRNFTTEERQVVAAYIEATDYWLFRGLLLQFFCYVRPVELTRLRFRDFDFSKGLVTITEEAHKKWREVVKTIPASVMPYFADGKFEKYPVNFFVFGRVGTPGHETMEPGMVAIDEERMYKRHAKVLSRLKDDGRLVGDLSGLTWYSWKDTGISLHAHSTTPLATRDQAGHTSIVMTEVYYHVPKVNEEYKRLDNDLMSG